MASKRCGSDGENFASRANTSDIFRIAAIGPATKRALLKSGLKVKMVPEEYVAESVVRGLRDKVGGKRVLLVRAKVARDCDPEELRAAGAKVDVVEAMRRWCRRNRKNGCAPLMKNSTRRPHLVTFTSSSLRETFMSCWVQPGQGHSGCTARLNRASDIGTLRELQLPVAIEARDTR